MCGLSGVAGRIFKREEDAFENLLYFMAIRGMHSTGIATVALSDSRIRLAKELGTPDYLIGGKDWNKAMAVNCKVIMGHNRFATKGEVKLFNAHPFAFKHVVGMHNGTIFDYSKKKLPHNEMFRTDSEAVIASIEAQGIEKTVPELDGAYALVWYDERDDTINMIRNKDRPLYYAFDKDHKVLFWASEVELLASAMNRNGISRTEGEKSHFLTVDTWMSWRMPKANSPFDEPARQSLKGWTYTPSTTSSVKGRFKNWQSAFYPGAGDDLNDPIDPLEDATLFDASGEMSPFVVGQVNTQKTASKHGPLVAGSDISGLTDTLSRKAGEADVVKRAAQNFKEYREQRYPGSKTEQVTPFRQPSKAAALKASIGGDKKGSIEEIYKDDICRIFYDTGTNTYYKHQWIPETREWFKSEFKGKPDFLVIGKPPQGPNEIKIYETPTLVVYRDRKADRWIRYEFDPKAYGWSRVVDNTPPADVPFTPTDVLSNHQFRHKGKKQHKQIFYKGWNGTQLTPATFNTITQTGCVGCGRTPEWKPGQYGGVIVHFISPYEFLCEHCGDTPDRVKGMISLNKAA